MIKVGESSKDILKEKKIMISNKEVLANSLEDILELNRVDNFDSAKGINHLDVDKKNSG